MTTTSKTDTVKLHMAILINVVDDEADTGVTVEEWNAMDDNARQAVVQQMWDTYAQQDEGGVRVVTPGAEEI